MTLAFTTAEQTSVEAFMSVSAQSPHQPSLQEYLEGLLRQGLTRPEWCVFAVEDDRPVARAAFWAGPGHSVPTDIVLIETDWVDDALLAGRRLLANLHKRATALGAGTLRHMVDSPPVPPQFQSDERARTRLLDECGYRLVRDGLRWHHVPAHGRKSEPESALTFRPLPDVGETAFVDAIAATLEGTADSALGDDIEALGAAGAAREYVDEMRAMTYQPEWWELAFTGDGALVGVSMVGGIPGAAVIAYVGVVPSQRRRGFASQLVERGTMHLVRAGAEEIRGDCDRDNPAMVKAFERAGYTQFARRRMYSRTLDDRAQRAT
jgi:ribosomal protein S18 acetylase RimI-like enzyme